MRVKMSTNSINPNISPCTVCLEDVFHSQTFESCDNETIRHVFHRTCAEAWANQFDLNKKVTCPTCRTYHLIDVIGTKEEVIDPYEAAMSDFRRWTEENPNATFEDIRARASQLNARLGREAIIIIPASIPMALSVLRDELLTASPLIAGLSLGLGLGLEFYRRLTIAALNLGGMTDQKNKEEISNMHGTVSVLALSILVAVLAKDLLTKRRIFNEMNIAKQVAIFALFKGSVAISLTITLTNTIFSIAINRFLKN
jgi:hypothetical protein